ncbi:flagellar filament capping protein FliD [Breoghania sp. L-A4]|uniref:flagellar filament capping protein FliD n=1 Tax=Breoghania sp. L-A4 TaxID=2304600 RepID=UPI000E35A3F7|nr:flagellar filament capping protein FliD [Breoghania sp. L-A4]AXS41579.1 flagellar hook protein [Breoghania sp. L-A4]
MADVSATTSTTATAATNSASYTYSSSSSDIDWTALVDSMVLAKELPADTIDVKITENETKIAAYQEMQSLLQAVADAADTIRGTDNSLTANDDAFSTREAYLTAQGDVDAASAVVITVANDADIATYDLQIIQIATVQKVSSAAYEESAAELALEGTFTLALEGMESVDITVTADMSLREIAERINDSTDTTGVQASVIKVSESDYQLILSGTDTGRAISITAASGTDVATALGITTSDGAFANELQASQDAIIRLDGVEITRDSNDIDDVIDGVTFNLYQPTGEDASITIEVSPDLNTIKTSITTLVDAYNAYREWAITQQATASGGGASDDAALFANGTLRMANSAIADALSTIIDSESMALLGLTYDNNNMLELDDSTLNTALLNDLDQVENLLNFQMTSSSSDVALLSRSDSMPSELTLDIEVDETGAVTSVSVDGDASLFTINDARIIGAAGSAYEGITFVFTGDTSQSATLAFTAGIVERLFNAADGYANADDSILTSVITDLSETNEDLDERASDIRSRAEDYRDTLTTRYAAYQAAIEEAQSTLDYLEAYLNLGD